MKTIISLSFLLILLACNPSKIKEDKTLKDTIGLSRIDTAQYVGLPYWADSLDRFSDAYIDTFSVAGNKFRFVNPIRTDYSGGHSITLQKFINANWINTNITLEDNARRGCSFFHNDDINGDGYSDIVNIIGFTGVVYFYNPKINSFIDTSATEPVNLTWVLLDKQKNIYCDFQELKGMCGQIHSMLYTFKGFERYNPYDLELYNCDNDNYQDIITKFILRKCNNGNIDSAKIVQEIKLTKPLNTQQTDQDGNSNYFDFEKYWQQKYKVLLGSS